MGGMMTYVVLLKASRPAAAEDVLFFSSLISIPGEVCDDMWRGLSFSPFSTVELDGAIFPRDFLRVDGGGWVMEI